MGLPDWYLVGSKSSFTANNVRSFIISLLSILRSLTVISLSDYFIVRKALAKVSDLILLDNRSIYWYTKGTNWRAAVAVVASTSLVLRKCRIHLRRLHSAAPCARNSGVKVKGKCQLSSHISPLHLYINNSWMDDGLDKERSRSW